MKVDMDAVRQVSSLVQIAEVGMQHIEWMNHAVPSQTLADFPHLKIDHRLHRIAYRVFRDVLFAIFAHELDATAESASGKKSPTLITAKCAIRTVYVRTNDDIDLRTLPREGALGFIATSGRVHTRPYIRQLFGDLSARSGWPTILLPLSLPSAELADDLFLEMPEDEATASES